MGKVKLRAESVDRRRGFTLIELLVVISVIGMLVAMLMPALSRARESSRQAACMSNLRQFGVGMFAYADRRHTYCSGAFDWQRDGAVTEVGWVADLVRSGIPVGKMLCPSSSSQISKAYCDLLTLDTTLFDACVDRLGSTPEPQPDGTSLVNPCRAIAAPPADPTNPLAPLSEERRVLIEKEIFAKQYNTNYTASWSLVRSSVLLDSNGNLKKRKTECDASLLSQNSTLGPLNRDRADASHVSSSFLPLLGCGAPAEPLPLAIGNVLDGTPTTQIMTGGPVTNPSAASPPTRPSMQVPTFADPTPRDGALGTGWWAGWKATLQDYRNFGPVHRGACNILFADGSVRSFLDENRDGYLNNGFEPAPENGFTSNFLELPPEEVASTWSLK
jgi:prepilin-type N-terminal cleavage/methylation domain-containing protein/prepilin-type processing-associated H-X9-DG protein